jgi:pyridoxine/pyridoxamine 5'-phosphate oxidase
VVLLKNYGVEGFKIFTNYESRKGENYGNPGRDSGPEFI